MISYQILNAGVFPRVICDVCHKPLDDPYNLAHISETGEITFAHAGQCDRKLKRTPASAKGSENLVRFFARLLRNTGISRQELDNVEPILGDGFLGVVASRRKLDKALR